MPGFSQIYPVGTLEKGSFHFLSTSLLFGIIRYFWLTFHILRLVLESDIYLKNPHSSYSKMILEAKIWTLGILFVSGM